MADQANLAQFTAHDYLSAIKGRGQVVIDMATALQNGAPLDPRQLSPAILSLAALTNEFLRVLTPIPSMEAVGAGTPPTQPPANQNGVAPLQ